MTRKQTLWLTVFFVLSYAISWLMWWPFLTGAEEQQFDDVLGRVVLGSFGPTIAGLIVTGLADGRRGIGELGRRFRSWRHGWSTWAIMLWGLVPTLYVTMVALQPSALFDILGTLGPTIALLPLLTLVNIVSGPAGEELGWRGFALPRLLEMMGPMPASLLLGVVWAFWHLPLGRLVGWLPDNEPLYTWTLYPASIVALSVFMTWLHLRSRGSLLLAVLGHSAANNSLASVSENVDDGIITSTEMLAAVALGSVVAALPFGWSLLTGRGLPSRAGATPTAVSESSQTG